MRERFGFFYASVNGTCIFNTCALNLAKKSSLYTVHGWVELNNLDRNLFNFWRATQCHISELMHFMSIPLFCLPTLLSWCLCHQKKNFANLPQQSGTTNSSLVKLNNKVCLLNSWTSTDLFFCMKRKNVNICKFGLILWLKCYSSITSTEMYTCKFVNLYLASIVLFLLFDVLFI